MSVNTIFPSLGLSVIAVENGVYHLRRMVEQLQPQGDVIGLLFSSEPLTMENRNVKLFLQDVGAAVAPARIVYHWQTLDARRFEESGLDPLEVVLDASQIPDSSATQNYTRPDGTRTRHAVRLTTGEVVCYN
jgi:hypothetical protein